ncbi:hypothetical protein ACIQ9J_01645 [Streptomyces sp. NPDC094153]|uniref:hypothetical protein n=1 Tax=Streptomyces sp. NPDC094153 TaxID=3366058 RepID=UPI0037FADF7B
MTDQLTDQQLDEIEARAGHLYEYVQQPEEADVLAGTDVPALAAEVRRLRAELADFSGRVNELESRLCECEPVREHQDYRRPAFYQHEPHCPVNAPTAARP